MNKLRPLQVYFQSSEWIQPRPESLLFTYYTCARERTPGSQWECIRGHLEVSDVQSSPAYQRIQYKIVPVFRLNPFPNQTLVKELGSEPIIY
jgi:hypothetical protein